jgi:hypothetical protein
MLNIFEQLNSMTGGDYNHFQPREIVENLLDQIGRLKREAADRTKKEGTQFADNANGPTTDEGVCSSLFVYAQIVIEI